MKRIPVFSADWFFEEKMKIEKIEKLFELFRILKNCRKTPKIAPLS